MPGRAGAFALTEEGATEKEKGAQTEVPYVTLLPSASGQQAAVLCQGGGLLHSVPDPGGIVEPVRGGQQSEHGP